MQMHIKRLLVLKNTLIHSINLFYTLTIGVLSLVHLNDVPKLNTGFDDKIVHFILYAGLCLTWFLSLHILKNKSSLFFACLVSILFGIIIEYLQSIVTNYRSTELFDILANCLGIFTMAIIIHANKDLIVKKL